MAINTRTPEPNAATQPGDYHIIPVSRIQSFQVLSLAPDSDKATFASVQPAIGPVDIKRLEKREQSRIQQLKDYEKTRGKDVTKEAQAVFDAFKKLYVTM